MFGLDSLNELVPEKETPSNIDFIYYLFFKRGISLKEFNELPIPYILNIVKTHSYIKEEEEKELKKANGKG